MSKARVKALGTVPGSQHARGQNCEGGGGNSGTAAAAADPPSWLSRLKPFFPQAARSVADAEIKLPADRRYVSKEQRREFRLIARRAAAERILERLPREGECIHIVAAGGWSGFDLLDAIVALAEPASIVELYVSTLSFSRDNVQRLAELSDANKIGRVSFALSVFFRSVEAEPVEHLRATLATRGGRVIATRNHAKLLLCKLSDGRAVVVESSANARSARSIEQFAISADPALLDFHKTWLDELFRTAKPEAQTSARP